MPKGKLAPRSPSRRQALPGLATRGAFRFGPFAQANARNDLHTWRSGYTARAVAYRGSEAS